MKTYIYETADTDEKGNVSIVEEIVVEEYEEVFESADNSRNDSMSRTLNASVECLVSYLHKILVLEWKRIVSNSFIQTILGSHKG